MKSAIDVGSRPYGASVWAGKPAAVMSASPGAYGGFGANHHLRQCLTFLDMPVLQQPEAYLGASRMSSTLADGSRRTKRSIFCGVSWVLLSSGSDGCGTNERNAIERGVADSAFEAAAAVFAEKQLVDLTLAIGLMNAYNRMAISFRATPLALAD